MWPNPKITVSAKSMAGELGHLISHIDSLDIEANKELARIELERLIREQDR